VGDFGASFLWGHVAELLDRRGSSFTYLDFLEQHRQHLDVIWWIGSWSVHFRFLAYNGLRFPTFFRESSMVNPALSRSTIAVTKTQCILRGD